jgi:DNA-binding NtrC family response regulator
MRGEEIFNALRNGQQQRGGRAGAQESVILGESDALERVRFGIEQVAPTDTTVLILARPAPAKEAQGWGQT